MSWESGTAAQRLMLDYSSSNVDDTTWVEVGALTASAKIVEIFDSSGKAMELKTGAEAGTGDGNIPMFIMPGGNGRINLNLDGGSSGLNLYVRCAEASGSATTGLLLINIFT